MWAEGLLDEIQVLMQAHTHTHTLTHRFHSGHFKCPGDTLPWQTVFLVAGETTPVLHPKKPWGRYLMQKINNNNALFFMHLWLKTGNSYKALCPRHCVSDFHRLSY